MARQRSRQRRPLVNSTCPMSFRPGAPRQSRRSTAAREAVKMATSMRRTRRHRRRCRRYNSVPCRSRSHNNSSRMPWCSSQVRRSHNHNSNFSSVPCRSRFNRSIRPDRSRRPKCNRCHILKRNRNRSRSNSHIRLRPIHRMNRTSTTKSSPSRHIALLSSQADRTLVRSAFLFVGPTAIWRIA